MKTLYLDCFNGAAGDMLLGALIDAGADFNVIESGLKALPVEGYEIAAEKVSVNGVGATRFRVDVDQSIKQPHRHLRHIAEIIEGAELPDAVKTASLETFGRIADCEAQIHGTTREKVHFHEVGAVDSIVDIIGVHLALHTLAVNRVCASVMRVGSGTVKCAHGVLPVPAPATMLLLEGVPCVGAGVEGELVTPTGAALVTQLADAYGPMPELRIKSVGYGAGTRVYADRPNVVRAVLGESSDGGCGGHVITIVETNVDDMTGELWPPLIEAVLEAGARDAFLTPIIGKKGRPAHKITIMCDDSKVTDVSRALLEGAPTLGLRMRREERTCLERRWESVETAWGTVRIKLGILDGEVMTSAPEFEDCRDVAARSGVAVRKVYESALALAAGAWR